MVVGLATPGEGLGQGAPEPALTRALHRGWLLSAVETFAETAVSWTHSCIEKAGSETELETA